MRSYILWFCLYCTVQQEIVSHYDGYVGSLGKLIIKVLRPNRRKKKSLLLSFFFFFGSQPDDLAFIFLPFTLYELKHSPRTTTNDVASIFILSSFRKVTRNLNFLFSFFSLVLFRHFSYSQVQLWTFSYFDVSSVALMNFNVFEKKVFHTLLREYEQEAARKKMSNSALRDYSSFFLPLSLPVNNRVKKAGILIKKLLHI